MAMNKIAGLAVSISKAVEDGQTFAAPLIASKLKKGAEYFPTDQTILMLANIVGKLSDKQTFITRGELKKLYNQFYTRNNKCAQLLHDELGEVNNLTAPQLYQRQSTESNEVVTSTFADPVLANALESAFDKNIPLKSYGKVAAQNAQDSVKSSLESWNLRATRVDVEDGNKDFLVIKADYETPKGVTSFYIPVELKNDKIADASIFMGNTGPQELNHSNIKNYISTHAGSKLKIRASDILAILTKAASQGREISDAELALARLKSSRSNKSEYFDNQIIGQKLNKEASADVNLPKLEESSTFEAKFSSPQGVASFNLGDSKIKMGSELVARALANFGYRNAQIKVSGSDNNTIFYAVSIASGQTGFTVPVKVVAGKITPPSLMICNGSLSAFTADSISKLSSQNHSDRKAASFASPVHGLKPSDLVNEVREAMADQNTSRAEDALNVLRQSGDAKAYAIAFRAFTSGLSAKTAEKVEETTCSMVVKTSSSQHPVCGHTGLPLHKVYQDQHGNCRPAYRKGMDESYEGAYFMNHKIFG